MLGQSALTSAAGSAASNRVFIYEVEGLRQNTQSDQTDHSIRTSGTVLVSVPYRRMNEEMRRITRLGGKIVGIRAANAPETAPAEEGDAA